MKTRTKVVAVAAVGVISLYAILDTLTSRYYPNPALRDKTESQQADNTEYSLGDTLKLMSDAMIELYTNPSIETACMAHARSKEALVGLWAERTMPYDDRRLFIETYVQDANAIIGGLKLVQGHNEYMQDYATSIGLQIKIARGMDDRTNKFHEAEYWLWEWMEHGNKQRAELMKTWEQKYSPEPQKEKTGKEQMSTPQQN